MNVKGRPMRTIWLAADGRTVEIIDQTKLPHELVIVRLNTLEQGARAIRTMQVRGAPLIGTTAAYGVALAIALRPAGLALALAFAGDPPLFVLDEPTSGLDPQMRRDVQDHILAMKNEGRAVLLATHDMDEAERLCDRLAVMAGGHIIAMGTPQDLIARSPSASLQDLILQLTARP